MAETRKALEWNTGTKQLQDVVYNESSRATLSTKDLAKEILTKTLETTVIPKKYLGEPGISEVVTAAMTDLEDSNLLA